LVVALTVGFPSRLPMKGVKNWKRWLAGDVGVEIVMTRTSSRRH